ncbi:DUF1904 family protein [Clostridium bovifaecis]|uniref:DUF1904 family protein n=1 Tax=Clostridium bovifaecis TaxID=2184719 RepID=A0A6I6F078_9CLOT|nr:DUF1904 family protein [Clostridium bovifaecis]
MPALKFKAIEAKNICSISKALVDELQEIVQCPRDYFTLEVAQSTFISDGEFVEGYPVVEVSWFDRGQEVQDKVAKAVTKHIKAIGYANVDVIFVALKENEYYENGDHF